MAILESENPSLEQPPQLPLEPPSRPELELITRGDEQLGQTETLPGIVESPWGVELPADLSVEVMRDPSQEGWKNAYLINVIWDTGGKREAKVTLEAYPVSLVEHNKVIKELVVTGVGDPNFWGDDPREQERVDEFEIGLAGAMQALVDPKEENVLGQHRGRGPTRIHFNELDGPAGMALAKLQTPGSIRRVEKPKLGTEFYVDRTDLKALGEIAIDVRPAAPERLVAPQDPYKFTGFDNRDRFISPHSSVYRPKPL